MDATKHNTRELQVDVPTQTRERVKGGDFVPFHFPLRGQGVPPCRSPEAEQRIRKEEADGNRPVLE